MNTNNKGFSLVELMIVVAIIGLLAAIGVPQYSKFQSRARQSEAKSALGALYSAEQSFFQEWNAYTTDLRNAGFGVVGTSLRYRTGFTQAACTGYAAAAPTAPVEVAANNVSTAGAAAGVVAPVTAVSPGANFTTAAINGTGLNATAPAATNCVATAGAQTFRAQAAGDPKNTFTATLPDVWTMNNLKVLANPISSL